MRNTASVTGGKPIAIWLQSISDGNAVNPLVAFYDIHERKRGAILLFWHYKTIGDNVGISLDIVTLGIMQIASTQ
jgi:hypothetical protein